MTNNLLLKNNGSIKDCVTSIQAFILFQWRYVGISKGFCPKLKRLNFISP